MNAQIDRIRPTAVVVDDDADMAMMLSEFVQASGYETRSAQNFSDFILAMSPPPQVLVLDLLMPESCSERIVEWLVFQEKVLPVVLVSSLPLDQIEKRRVHMVELGLPPPAILRKPFWLQDVARVINEAVASTCPG